MDNLDETALNIFTDGSSYSNPRTGGLAIRFITIDDNGNEVITENSVAYNGATNNQMELQACVCALELITCKRPVVDYKKFSKIVIRTDSKYVTDNIDNAKYTWPKNGWNKSDGGPVLNAEQWKDLIRLIKKVYKKIEFKWIKGHKTSTHNKAVDASAKKAAKIKTKKRISIVDVRKKLSSKSTEIGSVKMNNQIAIIRIIQDEYLKVQKCYRYRYEITSKRNPYYQNIDIVTSNCPMSAGHSYFVKFNDSPTNPRVEKVYREIIYKSSKLSKIAKPI